MDDALAIAMEARAEAKAAHQRLDRMNGSIDRLGNKMEVVDEKVDQVLLNQANRDGRDDASKGFLESKRWWIALLLTVVTSSLFATILTVVFRH